MFVIQANGVLIGQERTENILLSHIEKYSCHVELGTRLQSFEQFADHVVAHLVKTTEDGREVLETLSTNFLLGSDGARGKLFGTELQKICSKWLFIYFIGVVRKQLGLTFVGETRTAERFVTGDIRITGLDSKVSHISHVPHILTNNVGQFWRFYGNVDSTMVSLRPSEPDTLFAYAIWGKAVDYKTLSSNHSKLLDHLRAATGRTDLIFGIVSVAEFAPNIRMVNKFSEGRVFVVGGKPLARRTCPVC